MPARFADCVLGPRRLQIFGSRHRIRNAVNHNLRQLQPELGRTGHPARFIDVGDTAAHIGAGGMTSTPPSSSASSSVATNAPPTLLSRY